MLTLTLVLITLSVTLTIFDGALTAVGTYEAEKILKKSKLRTYLLLNTLFKTKTGFKGFKFLIKTAKSTLRLLFNLCFFIYLNPAPHHNVHSFAPVIKTVVAILAASYFIDFIAAVLYLKKPKTCLEFLQIPVSCVLLLFIPLALVGFFTMLFIYPQVFKPQPLTNKQVVAKLKQTLEESDLIDSLDPSDKKLMISLASFKDKVARQIMIPRIKVFSIECGTSVQTAVDLVLEEGYSRVPVYKGNVDNMIGILLLKDLLSFYASTESDMDPRLQLSIDFLTKPATFTPETKKISHLLQEFRAKQTHLAIVVDEWGGTEGIVSIEDILEELVGEIADEYDTDEQTFFVPLASGGWIVDARMGIKDIEGELGVIIPLSPEYDTLGGYIFHKAGEIPKVGYKIHHLDFDLEVLSSSERSVDKVKIRL